MIAAAAAKPMTVLRIVLTPLLLEKPQALEGNTAIPVVLPRAAIGVRGGGPRWLRRNLLLDHRARQSIRRWVTRKEHGDLCLVARKLINDPKIIGALVPRRCV